VARAGCIRRGTIAHRTVGPATAGTQSQAKGATAVAGAVCGSFPNGKMETARFYSVYSQSLRLNRAYRPTAMAMMTATDRK